MGAGAQNNESAAEQAKDEVISDMIRGEYHCPIALPAQVFVWGERLPSAHLMSPLCRRRPHT